MKRERERVRNCLHKSTVSIIINIFHLFTLTTFSNSVFEKEALVEVSGPAIVTANPV
jgi:hypothetical protein